MTMPSVGDVHQQRPLGGKRPKNRLTDLTVDFVSLVSKGDNPPARVALVKRHPSGNQDNGEGMTEKDNILKDVDPAVVAYVEKLEEAVIKAEKERNDALAAAAAAESEDKKDDKDDGSTELEKILKNAQGVSPELVTILKRQQEEVTKANERAAEAERIAKAEAEARAIMLLKSRVSEQMPRLGDVDTTATLLSKVAKGVDADTYTALEKLLVAANNHAAMGAVFTEFGKTGSGAQLDPLMAKAAEIQKAHPEWTHDKCVDQAMVADPVAYHQSIAVGTGG